MKLESNTSLYKVTITLIVLLITINSTNAQKRDYFIEMLDGKKIMMDEFQSFYIFQNKIEYYPYSEGERKKDFFGDLVTKKININEIAKVMYDHKIYKPFEIPKKGEKKRLQEVIMFNTEYVMTKPLVRNKKISSVLNKENHEYYIYNSNNERIHMGSLKMKYKKEVMEMLKKHFPNCDKAIKSTESFLKIKENYQNVLLLGGYSDYDCSN